MLIILALPFHYSLRASWLSQQGTLEWSLRWAWFLSLDKIIKRMMAKPEAEKAEPVGEERSAKGAKQKPRPEKGSGDSASRPKAAGSVKSKAEPVVEAKTSTLKKTRASEPEDAVALDPSAKVGRVSQEGTGASSEAKAAVSEAESGHGRSVWQRFQTAQAALAELWAFQPWLSRWLGRFWHLFHFTPLRCWLAAGWGDPYQTFEAFRLVYALRPFLPKGLNLVTEPDFLQLRLDVELEFSGWFSPLQAIFTVLRLLIDPTTRRFYRMVRQLQAGAE